MEAAFELAKATIETHERTDLQAVDHAAFFEVLDNSPKLAKELREAALISVAIEIYLRAVFMLILFSLTREYPELILLPFLPYGTNPP